MNKLIAKISFCHDLEDGWYMIKYPDNILVHNCSYAERNHYNDILDIVDAHDWDYVWEGNDYYNPEKDKKIDEPWLNVNPRNRDQRYLGSCCKYNINTLCARHNPENYFEDYPKSIDAIKKNALSKLSSIEKNVLGIHE